MRDGAAGRVAVLAPSPLLTITIEAAHDERSGDDLHLHVGGQGYWIARMASELGADVTLCATFGGETGAVAAALAGESSFAVHGVIASHNNGAYVQDRRSGERAELAATASSPLTRHEIDELYGRFLVDALDADVAVLGGPDADDVVPHSVYGRLTRDLRANGKTVVADLAGEALDEVAGAGATVVKTSHEQMVGDGHARSADVPDLVDGMKQLHGRGATTVVVTRAEAPALLLDGERCVQLDTVVLHPVDTHGAGDSLTAGVAAGLARGDDVTDAVQLGVAAGALNVTRRGLGTGSRQEIERLVRYVELRPISASEVRS